MMKLQQAMLVLTMGSVVLGQRGSFAGTKPIGFPALVTTAPTGEELGNRFGEDNNAPSTTTQRLPIEAHGDRELVNRLSKLPVDSQPFWFINWQALEGQRNNPQTYPQRPNSFAPIQPTNTDGTNIQAEGSNSGNVNRNAVNTGSNSPSKESNSNTRNIDVSAFMNNNQGLLGVGQSQARGDSNIVVRTTPNEMQNNANSVEPEDALANRYDNDESIENTNPTSTPAKIPQKNAVFTSSPVGNPSTSKRPGKEDQPRVVPSHVDTYYPEIPDTFYPNFGPQTRWYPARSSFGPSHSNYDFMERRPISMPHDGFRRFDRPFYYL